MSQKVLLIDAIINLILGILLLIFNQSIINTLGVPPTGHAFYPNILGGVLFGIGIALLIEYFRRPGDMIGLGLGGAITINLCGGLVLALWLISGKLAIPLRGQIFLWSLVVVLVGISSVELLVFKRVKS